MTPASPPSVARYLTAALGSADGPTDADLLGRFADRRDQAAFELLVWRHAGMVLRVCRGVVRDHHAAEDVTQAAFLALARKAGSIGKRDAVAGWLYRVAHRLAVRVAARRSRFPTRANLEGIPARTETQPDDVSRLHAELARLPEKYRLPVLLCYFEGLTHADAARRLGWPVGTVAGRLARAKDLLHRRLTRSAVAIPAAGVFALLPADEAVALPGAFADETARAAVAFAAGEAAVPGVSTFTLELAKGAIRTMTLTKLQWAAAVVAVCGSLTAGGVLAMGQGTGAPPGPGGTRAPGAPTAGQSPAAGAPTADYAQRQRSLKNVKQIMLAMHNYESAYARFPTDVTDKNGKPLLSWRVELLPFLEQDALYRQFKRDESWDSEHNLRLLARMPDVFRTGIEPKDATHTYYQRFALKGGFGWPVASEGGGAAGPGGLGSAPGGAGGSAAGAPDLPGAGSSAQPAAGPGGRGAADKGADRSRFPLRIAEITDGTSNTLGLAEVGPAVAWTKPADLEVDLSKPMPKLWGPFANVVTAGAYDGAVYHLRPDIGGAVLKNYITPNGGEVAPELGSLKARFPADSAEEKKVLAKLVEENEVLIGAITKELEEHGRLLAGTSKAAKDVGKAEEQQQQLKATLEELRVRNRTLRHELGLDPGEPIRKK